MFVHGNVRTFYSIHKQTIHIPDHIFTYTIYWTVLLFFIIGILTSSMPSSNHSRNRFRQQLLLLVAIVVKRHKAIIKRLWHIVMYLNAMYAIYGNVLGIIPSYMLEESSLPTCMASRRCFQ